MDKLTSLTITKTIILLLLFLHLASTVNSVSSVIPANMDTTSCFSQHNFDLVYEYVEAQIERNARDFFLYKDYQFFIVNPSTIAIKKDNYTVAFVERKRGIFSLAKSLDSNRKLTEKANKLFCEILLIK